MSSLKTIVGIVIEYNIVGLYLSSYSNIKKDTSLSLDVPAVSVLELLMIAIDQ